MSHSLLIASGDTGHVGAHLMAADQAGELTLLDTRAAWQAPALLRSLCHHLAGKRPPLLQSFSGRVLYLGQSGRYATLVSTGIAPVTAGALAALRAKGVRTVNYLTDDPWNPANGARHFWGALKEYDVVFTPRTANTRDLEAHGCRDVRLLPFAYQPAEHYFETSEDPGERARYACDVAFIGGADDGRVRLLAPLLETGLRCNLYGGYWERHRATRSVSQGFVLGRAYRLAVSGAKVNICMGRTANRDGHAMRSYELPAMRAALVVEGTSEHRALFGPDEQCALYFRGAAELARQVTRLCANPALRERLADAAHRRVAVPENHYAARLRALLDLGASAS